MGDREQTDRHQHANGTQEQCVHVGIGMCHTFNNQQWSTMTRSV